MLLQGSFLGSHHLIADRTEAQSVLLIIQSKYIQQSWIAPRKGQFGDFGHSIPKNYSKEIFFPTGKTIYHMK